jgi:hypothetical protein
MIAGTFGPYLVKTARDHDTARREVLRVLIVTGLGRVPGTVVVMKVSSHRILVAAARAIRSPVAAA